MELEDEHVLLALEELKQVATDDWWASVAEEDKTAVDRGLADIAAGRVSPHSEVMDWMKARIKR